MKKPQLILLILFLLFMLPLVSSLNPLSNINCNYPITLIDTKIIDCSFTSSSTDKFPVFFIFTINDNNNGTIEQGEFNITSVDFDNMPLTAVYNTTYENYNNSWVITNNSKEINITKGEHKLNITINISEVADANNYTLETHIVSGLYLLSLSEETTSSSSSGGGSSFSSNVFNLDLVSKIEINVKEGHSIFFLFNKKTHTLKLNKIEYIPCGLWNYQSDKLCPNNVSITMSSTLQSFWLEIGDELTVNLDGKLIYVGLSEINNKTALISLNKEPKEIIPIIQPDINKTEQEDEIKEEIEETEKEVKKVLIIIFFIVLIAIFIYLVWDLFKILLNKKGEKKNENEN